MTSKKSSQLGEKLLQRGRTPNTESSAVVLPVNEMPMVLTLEQLRPNPDNPELPAIQSMKISKRRSAPGAGFGSKSHQRSGKPRRCLYLQ